MNKPKATKNKAKDVEKKPVPPIMPPQAKFYVLPDRLRQIIAQALLTSSPKQLSVGDVNQIISDLNQLREVK